MGQGTVFEVGSVVEFHPGKFEVEVWQGDSTGPKGEEPVDREACQGWGLVVTHRDGWTVETEIQPMVVCCGGLAGLLYHFNSSHRTDGDYYWYRMVS